MSILFRNCNRIGYHYFPDTLHYRASDLDIWLPELRALGASWITLIAPVQRAIPETFLRGLLLAGVEPILHFHLSLSQPPRSNEMQSLFKAYARWGIRYIVLFDRPNLRTAWPNAYWAQNNLVERFLDIYLPLAETAWLAGLTPVFPPLEPGGDYWDTAFLHSAFRGIRRRGYVQRQEQWTLGCYAWANNRPLSWGAGGPERWQNARPYYTPRDEEDQLGFRIFDWYLALARTELRQPCTILLLKAGSRLGDFSIPDSPVIDEASHVERNLEIARLINGEEAVIDAVGRIDPVPAEVLACNFWLLAAPSDSPYARQAWFQPNGRTLPVVGAFHQWLAS